ncbi:MAG: hypothetical protein AABY14_00075 [Nanoarchaeota archaeon]
MTSKVKEVILGLSITIILVFFVIFGIRAFYKSPSHEDFCPRDKYERQILSEEECIQLGGRWQANIPKPVDNDIKGWCDAQYTCNKQFNDIREIYNKNVFIIAGIVGIITIIIASILRLTSVSAGLLGGGVLTIVFGTIGYWSNLADF